MDHNEAGMCIFYENTTQMEWIRNKGSYSIYNCIVAGRLRGAPVALTVAGQKKWAPFGPQVETRWAQGGPEMCWMNIQQFIFYIINMWVQVSVKKWYSVNYFASTIFWNVSTAHVSKGQASKYLFLELLLSLANGVFDANYALISFYQNNYNDV